MIHAIAIAIVLACSGEPIGVMTRDELGHQRTYDIVIEAGKVSIQGQTPKDTREHFKYIIEMTRQKGIKTRFLEIPGCNERNNQ